MDQQLLEVVTDTARPPIDLRRTVAGVEDVQSFGDRAHVRLSGGSPAAAIAAARAALERDGVAVRSIRPIPPSLEDVFIVLFTRHGRIS